MPTDELVDTQTQMYACVLRCMWTYMHTVASYRLFRHLHAYYLLDIHRTKCFGVVGR